MYVSYRYSFDILCPSNKNNKQPYQISLLVLVKDVIVHEGDIIINETDYNYLVQNNQNDKRTTFHHYTHLWTSKILPYQIDSNMRK